MYPNQNQGYPPNPNMGGYPPNPQMPGYNQQPMPGFESQMPGYPPSQQQVPGFPQQQQFGMPTYPQQQVPGFPQQQQFGMPINTQQQVPGFPQQQQFGMPTYPQGQAYPQPGMPQFGQQMPPQGMPQFGQQMPPAGNFQQAPMGQQIYSQQAAGSFSQAASQPVARPTLTPAPNFNASNDAAALRKAMKGFGTDEDAIIEVLCRRTCNQRMEILRAFKTAYGKDLISDIKSECRNNFLSVLIALLTPRHEFYARELYEAMYGEGTDEDVLVEVMCGLSNAEIRAVNMVYGHLFGKSLEDALREDTSGCFKRIMVSLSTGNRDESMVVDPNAAKIDAQSLKAAGISRMGTDESEFNRILCMRNYEQIKLIAREYEQLTGHTLEKDIKKEFSGDVEDAMVAVLRCALNRSEFFAKRLHNSMSGLGTNDRDLIRLVVTRCEVDMMDIKDAFQNKYGKPLKSFIKGDTSGDYKHALFALIGETRS